MLIVDYGLKKYKTIIHRVIHAFILFYISGISSPNSTLYPALIIDIW